MVWCLFYFLFLLLLLITKSLNLYCVVHLKSYLVLYFYSNMYNFPANIGANKEEETRDATVKVSPKSTDPVHLYSLYSYL